MQKGGGRNYAGKRDTLRAYARMSMRRGRTPSLMSKVTFREKARSGTLRMALDGDGGETGSEVELQEFGGLGGRSPGGYGAIREGDASTKVAAEEEKSDGRPADNANRAAEVNIGGGFQDPCVRGFQMVFDQNDGTRLRIPDPGDTSLLEIGKVGDTDTLGYKKYRYRQEQRQQIFPVYEGSPERFHDFRDIGIR